MTSPLASPCEPEQSPHGGPVPAERGWGWAASLPHHLVQPIPGRHGASCFSNRPWALGERGQREDRRPGRLRRGGEPRPGPSLCTRCDSQETLAPRTPCQAECADRQLPRPGPPIRGSRSPQAFVTQRQQPEPGPSPPQVPPHFKAGRLRPRFLTPEKCSAPEDMSKPSAGHGAERHVFSAWREPPGQVGNLGRPWTQAGE